MTSNNQQQYIAYLHDNFVKYVNDALSFINGLLALPQVTEVDGKAFGIIKGFLLSHEVNEVEKCLSEPSLRKSTLDKMEKVYKDFVDVTVDHMHESPLFKQFLKNLSHIQIEQNKNIEIERLRILGIPIEDN